MRCTNSGSSYDEDNVDWTCKASLPPEFKLGSTDVICEGYSNPDDPFVLKGSCGVEYRLVLTDVGEEKYGSNGWFSGRKASQSDGYRSTHTGEEPTSETFFNFIFWCLFVGIGLWIAYSFVASLFGGNNAAGGRRRGTGNRGGHGGGYGGDDGNDPPPPYDPRPPRQTHSKPRSSPRTGASSQTSSEGWRPGFWTGAATGAAAASAANAFRNNRTQEQARQQENSWFNWGGNQNARGEPNWYNAGEGPSQSTRSSQSSSDAPSSSRYESTGFGGTSRR
jgi:hypothetical protein